MATPTARGHATHAIPANRWKGEGRKGEDQSLSETEREEHPLEPPITGRDPLPIPVTMAGRQGLR